MIVSKIVKLQNKQVSSLLETISTHLFAVVNHRKSHLLSFSHSIRYNSRTILLSRAKVILVKVDPDFFTNFLRKR